MPQFVGITLIKQEQYSRMKKIWKAQKTKK